MSSTLVRHPTLSFTTRHDRYNIYDTLSRIMKFTYLALFCCALWTLVSALPLGPLGSESTPRGTDERVEHRTLYARVETRAGKVPYAVSLKRADIGTPKEHWAYHFHPQEGHKGDLHIVEALSDTSKQNKNPGALRVFENVKGDYKHPTTQKPGSELHHIANFESKDKAEEAIRDIKNNVKLTEKFPDHNCVDFTCKAALHMAENKHIKPEDAKKVTDLHQAHGAAVRQETNTDENRAKAGA